MGPDVELGVHLLQGIAVAGDDVEPAERVGAGVPREALGLEHGGRGVVVRQVGGHEALEHLHGPAGGQRGLDLVVVAFAAVVLEAGIQPAQIDVPRALDDVGRGEGAAGQVVVGRLDLPGRHAARPVEVRPDLFGRDAPVGAGHDRRPAVELRGEARRLAVDLGVVDAVGGTGFRGRLNPFQEVRGAVIGFREDPGAVLHVDGVGGAAVLVHEILDGHAGIGPVVHQARGVAVPGGRPAAPRVVAVGCGHDQAGPGGIIGIGSDVGVDQALLPAGIARLVALDVVRGDHDDGLFDAGLRIHVLGLVQLVGVGRMVPGGFADVAGAEPPVAAAGRPELVGFVRRTGVDLPTVVFGRGIGRVAHVGGQGAAEMMAGDDGPLIAFIGQDVDHGGRKRHFRGEKALRPVGDGAHVPRLVGRFVEDLEFLAENFLRQHGAEGVVVGEADHLELPTAARGQPLGGLAVAVPPAGAVAAVAVGAEVVDVVDERPGIAHGIAAVEDVPQGVLGAGLVGVDAVLHAEDRVEVVFRMVRTGIVFLRAAVFNIDGILGELDALVLRAAVPFRPVDGLVVVPETRNAHVASVRAGEEAYDQGGDRYAAEGQAEKLMCMLHSNQPYCV